MRFIRLVTLVSAFAAQRLVAQTPPSQFVPAVEFRDTVANCVQPITSVQPGERGYALRFGNADSAQRIVTAIWGSDGRLVSYSDSRGDLRPPFPVDAPRNPRTTIKIDVPRHVALMYNDVDGEQQGSAASDADGAMDSENLGPPRRMLDRLRRQCGAP